MSNDIVRWLEAIGLARYSDVFVEHDVDTDVLPDLTDTDLEKLGISLGHRKKLLRAASALREPRTAVVAAEETG